MTGQPAPTISLAVHRRRRWKVGLVALLVLAAIWTVALGWWLPGWAKGQVETQATRALGVPVALNRLAFNPWTLNLTVTGLKVGALGAELLQVPEAQVQLSLESIWRLAPVVRRVTLTQPDLWIERQTDQRFNFSDIAQRLQAQPSKPGDEPAHFAVYNIRVNQGRVRYTDRVLKQEHRVEALNIGVPFVSNLPSFTTVDVQPLLEARVDGSALRVSGRTLPFSAGRRTTVDLNWSQIDVAQWALAAKPFMPPSLALDVAQGQLATNLTVTFQENKPPALPKLLVHGGLKLSNADVNWPAGGVQGRWSMLTVDGLDLGLLAHRAKVGSVSLTGLMVDAKAPPQSASAPAARASAIEPVSPSKEAPWTWSVDKVKVAATAIKVQAPGGAALPAVGPVTFSLDGLNSNPKAAPAQLRLDAADALGGQWGVTGMLTPTLPQAILKVAISKVQPAPWLAALDQVLHLPLHVLAGEAALSTDLYVNGEGIKLSQGQVSLSGLKTRSAVRGVSDHVDLAGLNVQGVEAQWALAPASTQPSLSLALASVQLDQLNVQATRDRQGQWLMLPAPSATPAQQATKDAKPALPPIINVAQLRCLACKVIVDDQTVTPAARLSLQQTDLALKGASTDLTRVVDFEVNGLAQGNGRFKVNGDVRLQPMLLHTQLSIAGLDLKALQPYAAPHVNITLAAAKAHANGKLSLQADAGKPDQPLNARYQGRVALTDLRTQDSVNQADLLRWRSLALDNTDVAWSGGALNADLGRIALNDFYGRLIINPSGRINLADLVKHESGAQDKSLTTPQVAASAPAQTAPPAPAASAASQSSGLSAMNLRWQGIKLGKGRVDFTDTFIKPNYSARLTQIEGDVSAVASSKPEPATVKISGAVDDSAPLLITGQLHPLGPRLYTDIQGSAKGIELTRLTPYAARYAGYAIEKGTLSMTVHYKVDNGKLEADNQIFLDQLTFGQKVDSPDATTLPVQFALSLLKNSRGEIDVNLPISGSLDDPQFSVGGIVWRVIVNLLTKAVTAPFALLSGSGHDELGFVPFEPGTDELSDTARQRLDTLVAKLADRPQIKLEATGRADPAVDEEGLRNRHVMRLMRKAKGAATEQPLEAVTISPAERDQWLAAAYKAADIKKPRNLVGIAKTLPPAEMEALLKASVPVDQASYLNLANRRGDRVKAYVASKLPPERVLLTASKLGTEGLADDKGPTARVQFTLK